MAVNFLETDIEQIIFDNRNDLHNRGFIKFLKNTNRQHRLPSGKIIDLITFQVDDDAIRFKVIELKRGEINIW